MDQDVPVGMDVRDHVEETDLGEGVYTEQQEEFLTQQEQNAEVPEEDAWNLEEEFEYYDQEEDVSPFYLF